MQRLPIEDMNRSSDPHRLLRAGWRETACWQWHSVCCYARWEITHNPHLHCQATEESETRLDFGSYHSWTHPRHWMCNYQMFWDLSMPGLFLIFSLLPNLQPVLDHHDVLTSTGYGPNFGSGEKAISDTFGSLGLFPMVMRWMNIFPPQSLQTPGRHTAGSVSFLDSCWDSSWQLRHIFTLHASCSLGAIPAPITEIQTMSINIWTEESRSYLPTTTTTLHMFSTFSITLWQRFGRTQPEDSQPQFYRNSCVIGGLSQ